MPVTHNRWSAHKPIFLFITETSPVNRGTLSETQVRSLVNKTRKAYTVHYQTNTDFSAVQTDCSLLYEHLNFVKTRWSIVSWVYNIL